MAGVALVVGYLVNEKRGCISALSVLLVSFPVPATRKPDAKPPSVFGNEFDSCRFEGGTNRLKSAGLELIALL
ncbi:hypothetical protein X771_09025 [Mesorhizobium sp. LSJC277A00]|nr:hypothetical protein X771_09025 [Mesorhizobium sp. LSJC277A00]ESX25103.1 hypothetical protein X767_10370 [Mesorhizobium sp. LSJC264A00]ESZ25410.1 hypothetical protein X733_31165 [Mesorhizobium sp. L2C067A000]